MNKRIFSGPFLVFMLCGTIIPLGVIAFYGMTDRSGTFTLDNITAIATGEHWQACSGPGPDKYYNMPCNSFPAGAYIKRQQAGQERLHGVHLYTSHVDEFPAQDYGVAGTPRKKRNHQSGSGIFRHTCA